MGGCEEDGREAGFDITVERRVRGMWRCEESCEGEESFVREM